MIVFDHYISILMNIQTILQCMEIIGLHSHIKYFNISTIKIVYYYSYLIIIDESNILSDLASG